MQTERIILDLDAERAAHAGQTFNGKAMVISPRDLMNIAEAMVSVASVPTIVIVSAWKDRNMLYFSTDFINQVQDVDSAMEYVGWLDECRDRYFEYSDDHRVWQEGQTKQAAFARAWNTFKLRFPLETYTPKF